MQDFFRTIFRGLSDCEYGGIESQSVNCWVGEPLLEDLEDIVDLFFGERLALWDTMPLLKALPAAGACCMLGDKDWMVSHGCLPPVVNRIGLCQSLRGEITGVLQDGFNTFLF